jgi:hypothetical protein
MNSVLEGLESAVHRFALHRVRDTIVGPATDHLRSIFAMPYCFHSDGQA